MSKLNAWLRTSYQTFKNSIRRYPETLIIAALFSISLILRNRLDYNTENSLDEILRRLSIVFALSIPLSLCGLTFQERIKKQLKKQWLYRLLTNSVMILFGIFFFNLLPSDWHLKFTVRYWFALGLLTLLFITLPFLASRLDYSLYLVKTLMSFLITYLYTFVLYLGVIAIIFTLDTLFDLNMDEAIYFDVMVIAVFVFGLTFFLGRLGTKEEIIAKYAYPPILKGLVITILLPLIAIYTLILYFYFIRLMVVGGFSEAIVSHLILWYAYEGVTFLILSKPLRARSRMSDLFGRYFPLFLVLPCIILGLNLGIRISTYGVTVPRALGVISVVWFVVVIVYEGVLKRPGQQWLVAALVVLFVLTIYSPLNIFSMTVSSQKTRVNNLLIEADLLESGQIIKIENTDPKVVYELSSQLKVLEDLKALDKVAALPSGFELKDMKRVFGFDYAYDPYNRNYETNYFDFFAEDEVIRDVSEYDLSIHISDIEPSSQVVRLMEGNLKFSEVVYKDATFTIETIYLSQILSEKYQEDLFIRQPTSKAINIDIQGSNYQGVLILTRVNGEKSSDGVVVESLDGILYLSLEK